MNTMAIPTLLVAYALFSVGRALWKRPGGRGYRSMVAAVAIVASLPGLLYAVYYAHVLDRQAWFYELRSLPASELAAAGLGLLGGVSAAVAQRRRICSQGFVVVILTLGIIGPYLKPVILPVPARQFQDHWVDDVCLQSTPSSCGPASAATILRKAGVRLTEQEIARNCFTYLGGTENWYLARFLRKQGLHVTFETTRRPSDGVPVPSIAGVLYGKAGHFIPVIDETATSYITGDPLIGRQEWPKDGFGERFHFTGFFMRIGM